MGLTAGGLAAVVVGRRYCLKAGSQAISYTNITARSPPSFGLGGKNVSKEFFVVIEGTFEGFGKSIIGQND